MGSNCLVRGFRDVTVGVNTIMANAMFTCCLNCCGDGGSGHIPLKEMPTVQLDTHHMGKSASSVVVYERVPVSEPPVVQMTCLREDGSLLVA